MGNYLKMADKHRIQALLELGWSYRRIQRATGVRRETVARYDPKRDSKPANLSTGSGVKAANVSAGPQSAAEPYREVIDLPDTRVAVLGDDAPTFAECFQTLCQLQDRKEYAAGTIQRFLGNEIQGLAQGVVGADCPFYSPSPTCHRRRRASATSA